MRMPSVSGRHDGRTILSPVAIVDVSRWEQQRKDRANLFSGVPHYRALIDTGATTTMLTQRVVADLELLPIGTAAFRGIHGVDRKATYLFHVAFVGERLVRDELVKRNIHTDKIVNKLHVNPEVIEGGELEDQPHFDVLLGMDILRTGDLHVLKTGSFQFTF